MLIFIVAFYINFVNRLSNGIIRSRLFRIALIYFVQNGLQFGGNSWTFRSTPLLKEQFSNWLNFKLQQWNLLNKILEGKLFNFSSRSKRSLLILILNQCGTWYKFFQFFFELMKTRCLISVSNIIIEKGCGRFMEEGTMVTGI